MSSGTQIQQNLVPSEPQLADLLDLTQKQIKLDLNCHAIGSIASFASLTQQAEVSIAYTKTFLNYNSVTQVYESISKPYPVIVDAPVIFLGGGDAALTFPIETGDECLVLFNDRDIDNWFTGTQGAAVATPRLHSFSDAVILVGLRSTPNVIQNFDPNRAVLRNGTALVGVGTTLIKIANNTTTLNTLLQNLITAIESLVSATAAITVTPGSLAGPSSPPLNVAAINAVGTTLSSLATQIGGLLE